MSEGRTPCGNINPTCHFDPTKYGSFYPDLQNAFGNDKNALTNHYKNYGINENRRICGITDADKAAAEKAAADKAAADKAAADKAAADKAAADKAAADKAAADKQLAINNAITTQKTIDASNQQVAINNAVTAQQAIDASNQAIAIANAVTSQKAIEATTQAQAVAKAVALAQQQQQLTDALQNQQTIVKPSTIYTIPFSESFSLYK